ncbi:Pif1p-like protein, partial [Leptotrombidium deliense]
NDSWAQIQALLDGGLKGKPNLGDSWRNTDIPNKKRSPVNFPCEVIIAAQQRFLHTMHLIKSQNLIGEVENWYFRAEYQNRGAIHWHIVWWVKPGTIPPNCIVAELADANSTDPDVRYLRQLGLAFQIHSCRPRCGRNEKNKYKCKYGFPYSKNNTLRIDKDGLRYLYVRKNPEDANVVPYVAAILAAMQAHVNAQYVTTKGVSLYIFKYLLKEASRYMEVKRHKKMGHDGKTHSVRFRSISVMEMYHNMLGFPTCESSLKVIYLPTDLDPEMKVLKNYHYLYGKDRTSEDVWVNSALDYYVNRPDTDHQPPNFRHNMNDICYHDFFKFYNIDHNNYSKKEGLVHTLFPNTRVVPRTVPAVCRWHIIHMDEDIKKYCLQQLILYKPFRTYDDLFSSDNINKDPIAECMTMGREKHPHFQFESIPQMTFHYLEQLKQKQFDPKKILEYAQSLISKGYLTEADLNLYIETLDFDISEIAATESNVFQKVWDFDNGETEHDLPQPQTINYNDEQKQDFLKFTRERLTPDQRRIFNYFGKAISDPDDQCLLFITGSAGCGKTYLIRKLME